MKTSFDPFSDRTARDIRNSMSAAFVDRLTVKSGPSVEEVAASWLARVRQPVYRDYIVRRRWKYRKMIRHIAALGVSEPRSQSLELWNAGLFFELHELLETVWHGTRGNERMGLKGLIQAAGAYVHRDRGKPAVAIGLARRARRNLSAGADSLMFVANLDTLIDGLKNISDPPPVLKSGRE